MARGINAGPPAVAIVGPTATGKSEVAVRVAAEAGGEIVSVDSRQAYRGMEVGTAAPGPEVRERMPHHGVAFLDPDERYGAGCFARRARRWIAAIRDRGRLPVLAGGTGLFLRALTDPVFREPPVARERRARLRAWLDARAPGELRRWARRLDPALEGRLDHLDPQRCSRTLELALLAGRPLTWWQDHGEPEAPPLEARIHLLWLDAETHRARIEARVERQLEAGWVDEVRRLRAAGHGPGSAAWDALGYREVAALADGDLERSEAVRRIARQTWQYARRQRTWFRNQLPEAAVRLDASAPVTALAGRILRDLEGESEGAERQGTLPAGVAAGSEDEASSAREDDR